MNWTPGRSARIARMEYRRSVRAIGKKPVQMLAFGLFALIFIGVPTVAGSYFSYKFGGELATTDLPLIDIARGGLAVWWVMITVMLTSRVIGKTGRIDQEAGMLTTVPARDVVGGLLGAEFARVASIAAIPIVAITAALSLSLGTPLPLVTIVLALLGLLATALLTGHILGLLIKLALERSEILAQYKSVLAVLVFVIYMAAVMSNALGEVMAFLAGVLQNAPTAWFGDLLVLGIPGVSPSLVRVGGAVALVVVGLPILFMLDVRLATRLWYGDRVQPENKQYESSESNADFLAGIASQPTRSVVANVWRRTKRSPIRLLYVVYPVFFITGPVQETIRAGQVTETLPVVISLYGAWAIGGATLNPLGDEGAMLPVTLTSSIRGKEFVVGHVLSVTIVGLPIVVLATALTGFLSPLEPARWLSLTALSVLLGLAGAVVAISVGTTFPRFGEVNITKSRTAVVPSKTAFATYSLALLLGYGGAVTAITPGTAASVSSIFEFVTGVLGYAIVITPPTVRLIGGVIAVLLGIVAPPLAYLYSVRRFETYTLDSGNSGLSILEFVGGLR
jgi:ABC-2 type transport system permease protein